MNFEGPGGFDYPGGVGVGFVQLELDFAEPVRYVVFGGEWTEVEGPGVGVFGGDAVRARVAGWVEGAGEGTEDCGGEDMLRER